MPPSSESESELSLTPKQIDFIEFIAANQPVSTRVIMESLDVERRAAYQVVSDLGRMGLVTAEPDISRDYPYRRPDLISINNERATELSKYFGNIALRMQNIADTIGSENA
jgi:DNA-binding MarR family transcriptional regulator